MIQYQQHSISRNITKNAHVILITCILAIYLLGTFSCSKEEDCIGNCNDQPIDIIVPTPIAGMAIQKEFGDKIDPNKLYNYANQGVPSYIKEGNGADNPITDEGATLGRVLFYDKMLSIDNTISCASCHQQAFAFSDPDIQSKGVEGGLTGRHSMRLINTRFNAEKKYFWDERAESLEIQTTMPIKDHAELGFSGENGRPGFEDLLVKLQSLEYYQELFTMVYGDAQITESRIQKALAQFIRSIQSFDTRYDEGYTSNFTNFTEAEKRGMALFNNDPQISNFSRIGGGTGCFNCHRPPAFDINPSSGNNSIISVAGKPGEIDIDNTKAPTLRNLANSDGILNGPLMHDGSINSFRQLLIAISTIGTDPRNTKLDPLLPPGAKLNITMSEADDIAAFLKTLSGVDVYKNEKWSDPFE